MILNACWLIIFQLVTKIAYLFAAFIIALILLTSFKILSISLRNKLNYIEIASIRSGFTIYTAWITSATMLNIAIFLKTFGVKDDKNILINEELIAIIMVWTALIIYMFITIKEKNPLFGLIYVWVILAIYSKQ